MSPLLMAFCFMVKTEGLPMTLLDYLNIRNGQLTIGQFSAQQLAQRFGTPPHVMDEKLIRQQAQM
ncbi:MAG: hypothetical protein M0C28_44640 [Candidatus Moduliflexus flocculans]|nr:hypothetical protein [Candidatus Moduliflexus flocculans]